MPGGELFLADAILPAVWDAERDLVILVGPGVTPVAAAMRQLGQQRIVWYVPGREEPDAEVAALRVEDDDELVVAVRGFGAELSVRAIVRALDGGQADSCARADELFREARNDMLIHRNTVMTFNRTWLEQGLTNLRALCTWPSVAALDGELTGLPLVIVAGAFSGRQRRGSQGAQGQGRAARGQPLAHRAEPGRHHAGLRPRGQPTGYPLPLRRQRAR